MTLELRLRKIDKRLRQEDLWLPIDSSNFIFLWRH